MRGQAAGGSGYSSSNSGRVRAAANASWTSGRPSTAMAHSPTGSPTQQHQLRIGRHASTPAVIAHEWLSSRAIRPAPTRITTPTAAVSTPTAVHTTTVPQSSSSFWTFSAWTAWAGLFAAPMALELLKPLVPLRKPGKLPYRTHSASYDLEYGSAELHVHIDGINPGARVLLVDDVLATGGTMAAACRLIEKAGGSVAGCAFLIELSFLKGREKLPGIDIFSLLTY